MADSSLLYNTDAPEFYINNDKDNNDINNINDINNNIDNNNNNDNN